LSGLLNGRYTCAGAAPVGYASEYFFTPALEPCYTCAMEFCSNCGHRLTSRVPEGDTRTRDCCNQCGTIHYVNPKLVVGTIPVWGSQVLLCRRAIEPRRGYWTLPAGFMEMDETTAAGALRETDEEAGAQVELGPLFSMFDVVHVGQVHVFYRARLLDRNFHPGIESLEVRLFEESEVPWADLAFRTVSLTLEHFFSDRQAGTFGLHTGAIQWPREASTARAALPQTAPT
jgi:ADP-ribose pyrophosphatase YjhB (NUDIX family)